MHIVHAELSNRNKKKKEKKFLVCEKITHTKKYNEIKITIKKNSKEK